MTNGHTHPGVLEFTFGMCRGRIGIIITSNMTSSISGSVGMRQAVHGTGAGNSFRRSNSPAWPDGDVFLRAGRRQRGRPHEIPSLPA